MTDTEEQELRDWAARKMGWHTEPSMSRIPCYYDNEHEFKEMVSKWQPDNPDTGQIWLFVERMRELGWNFEMWIYEDNKENEVVFFNSERLGKSLNETNPCLAILKAARATEEG